MGGEPGGGTGRLLTVCIAYRGPSLRYGQHLEMTVTSSRKGNHMLYYGTRTWCFQNAVQTVLIDAGSLSQRASKNPQSQMCLEADSL